nr:hypothetical protein [Prescottella subtropica]
MQPVECGMCGNRVLVEKYSPTHTSTQWLDEATTACAEFRRRTAAGVPVDLLRSCGALDASIDAAVTEGRIVESPRTVPISGSTCEVRAYT